MASGIMASASFFSLLLPSLEMARSNGMGKLSFIPAVLGFIVGMLFLLVLDLVIPHMHMDSSEEGPRSGLDSSTKLVYQAISDQLAAVGIKANIKSYDHSAWLDRRIAGEMDSFVARWGMDYNDPANIMYTFFGSTENSAQRSLNYPDTAVMERVSAARAIVDDDERMAEYQALEKKIISEDVAWVPLYEEQHLYCMGDRVESFTPHWAGFSDFYVQDVVLK